MRYLVSVLILLAFCTGCREDKEPGSNTTGEIIESIQEGSLLSTFVYKEDRLIKIDDLDGFDTRFVYNSNDELISIIDTIDKYELTYDMLGRLDTVRWLIRPDLDAPIHEPFIDHKNRYDGNDDLIGRSLYEGRSGASYAIADYTIENGNITIIDVEISSTGDRARYVMDYDDKKNYLRQDPRSIGKIQYWNKNNITRQRRVSGEARWGNACQDCTWDYRYNLDDFPTEVMEKNPVFTEKIIITYF